MVLAAAALLAGCGGGDGDEGGGAARASSAASEVPASAMQSSEGLAAFMASLIKNGTDSTSAPLMLGDATLPKSDTTEPSSVN